MAAAILEFILYVLIPQTKVGFKVFSVLNLKIPGQISIPEPGVWAHLTGQV